ncbi:hypothetical protein L3Y34_006532 [Caenorhabditis briggsae]|uniref:RING-type domain-containing protein n=1 Tax=Caenorhabditis briggsae TaxID=6238 RepID=A0AAE9A1L5_CAEBR|nr:hypothetical protein L3Y34_006532 [Caenorhabditis briggsae]
MSSISVVDMDLVLSSVNLRKLVSRCIPKELIPTNWKCKKGYIYWDLKDLLKLAETQLGMFESDQALLEALLNFLRVPGCPNLLQFNIDDSLMALPEYHMSLKGSAFIYKSDIYALTSAIPCPFIDWRRVVVQSALNKFRRNMEIVTFGCEMVDSSNDILEKLAEQFDGNCWDASPCSDYDTKTDFKHAAAGFNIAAQTAEDMYEVVERYMETFPLEENKADYGHMFTWIISAVRFFLNFVEKNFPVTEKATVRLFVTGKENYVMAHELLQSLKNKNLDVSGFEEEIQRMPALSTLEFRDVARKVKIQDMKNTEFIRIQSSTPSLTAIPIPSPDGGYCVRASDALHELLVDMLLAKKVLQTVESEAQLEHLEKYFVSVQNYFDSDRGVFFISLNELNVIKSKWEECYEANLKNSKQAKSVRAVGNEGFSLEDLEKELKYLDLDKVFPDIYTVAEWSYESVLDVKPKESLNQTDMTYMIYQCQVAFFLYGFPFLYRFLHSQKICTKWVSFLDCLFCKNGHAELPKSSKRVREENPSEEAESEVPRKKKRSKKAKKAKETESSDPEPTSSHKLGSLEAKESQACPKCFRASHFADVANEKLRLSKVECKHLKKDLANAELEVEVLKQKVADKDERIRMLEELLKSKDDIIEKQNMDLLKNQDTIMNLEMEVDSKDNIIEDLKISLAEKDQSSEVTTLEPTRGDEETEKVRDVLFKLLEIQATLQSGNPIGKCRELAHRIYTKAQNKEIKDATVVEAARFCKAAKIYSLAVNTQLEMIRGSQLVKPDEIPDLPNFPVLSQGFLKAYEDIYKSEAPKICHSLLKTPEVRPGELADTDCLICIEEMDSEEGTIKCECCKRRYHVECAKEWFKMKRTCPACSSVLLDGSEFPPLG